MGKNEPLRDTQDAPTKAKPPRPSLIEFLSNPGHSVAPEVELDLRRGRPGGAARDSKFLSSKKLLALTCKRGAMLTEADARAIDELKSL